MKTNWKTSNLKEMCVAIFSGGTPQTSERDYWNGTINWLSSGETRNRYIRETEKKITPLGVERSSTRQAMFGDIVIASAGQGWTRGQTSFCMIDTYINQSLIAIRTQRNVIDPQFLLYNFLNRYDELRSLSDSSSTRGSLTCRMLEALQVKYPPILTQCKIVTLLSSYDRLIENNLRRIKILEDIAQDLYREWFVKFRFPDHRHVRFVDSPLGRIPAAWENKTLLQFGNVITGKTPSKANPNYYGKDVPFVKTPDMHGNIYILGAGDRLSISGAQSQSNKTIPVGSICVSCIGTIGVVSITSEICQTNQQINSVILFKDYHREFLFFFLKESKQTLENLGSNGATMGNVNKGKFESLEVLTPSDDLITRYHQFAAPLFSEILVLSHKNTNLRRTRDMLLPKIIFGELDISDLDITIPEEIAA